MIWDAGGNTSGHDAKSPTSPRNSPLPTGADVEFRHVQAPGERARSSVDESLIVGDRPIGEQVPQLAVRMPADDPRKTAGLRGR